MGERLDQHCIGAMHCSRRAAAYFVILVILLASVRASLAVRRGNEAIEALVKALRPDELVESESEETAGRAEAGRDGESRATDDNGGENGECTLGLR